MKSGETTITAAVLCVMTIVLRHPDIVGLHSILYILVSGVRVRQDKVWGILDPRIAVDSEGFLIASHSIG